MSMSSDRDRSGNCWPTCTTLRRPRPDLAAAFDTGDNFRALRLEPYLLATGVRHPDLAPTLAALVERTAAGRIALVHGDVSPKNILVGPDGPVLLDAECAWYGDPAFDIAFCLNHLLLKAVLMPQHAGDLLRFVRCTGARLPRRPSGSSRARDSKPGRRACCRHWPWPASTASRRWSTWSAGKPCRISFANSAAR